MRSHSFAIARRRGLRQPRSASRCTAALQVRLYFPEVGHPAFGVIRAIVKDSTDVDRGTPSIVFVDSDGQVASTSRNASSPGGNGTQVCVIGVVSTTTPHLMQCVLFMCCVLREPHRQLILVTVWKTAAVITCGDLCCSTREVN